MCVLVYIEEKKEGKTPPKLLYIEKKRETDEHKRK